MKRLQILAALALLTASPAQGELPTYTCVKTAAAPRIDGRNFDLHSWTRVLRFRPAGERRRQSFTAGESPRLSRRLQELGESESWDAKVGFHRRFANAQFAS